MTNQRLDDLILDELKNLIGMQEKLLARKKALLKTMGGDLDAIERYHDDKKAILYLLKGLIEDGLSIEIDEDLNRYLNEGIPEYDAHGVRDRVLQNTNLELFAHFFAYEALGQEVLSDSKGPYVLFSSVHHIIYDYFIKGKIKKSEEKLPAYEETVQTVSDDEALRDSSFATLMIASYEVLETELRDVSFPLRVNSPDDIEKMIDKTFLNKYLDKLKTIRGRQVLIEAMSRIYDRYKEGDDSRFNEF